MPRWLVRLSVIFIMLALLFLLRHPLLRGMGGWLDASDPPHKVDAIFVLAGGPKERAAYAATLYKQGYSRQMVCTGELVPEVLPLAGCDSLTEAQLTQRILLRAGVDSSAITLVKEGSSTIEEAVAILAYAQQQGWRHIAVVSSVHHTRRVSLAFRRRARLMGIDCLVLGAPPLDYEPTNWYRSEPGLLFVVNEYLKMGYYVYKY